MSATLPTGPRTRGRRPLSRRWAPLVAVPLVLALAFIGLRIIVLFAVTSDAREDYGLERYQQAADRYGSQSWANVINPWTVPYNEGTALLRVGSPTALAAAGRSLERAYQAADGQDAQTLCRVQTNLALAYEMSGDWHGQRADTAEADRVAVREALDRRAQGRPHDEEIVSTYRRLFQGEPTNDAFDAFVAQSRRVARSAYESALAVRERPGCPQSVVSDRDENQAAEQRIEDRLDAQVPPPAPSPDPTPDPGMDPAERQRQEELDKISERARGDVYQQQQEIDGLWGHTGDAGGGEKNW